MSQYLNRVAHNFISQCILPSCDRKADGWTQYCRF